MGSLLSLYCRFVLTLSGGSLVLRALVMLGRLDVMRIHVVVTVNSIVKRGLYLRVCEDGHLLIW